MPFADAYAVQLDTCCMVSITHSACAFKMMHPCGSRYRCGRARLELLSTPPPLKVRCTAARGTAPNHLASDMFVSQLRCAGSDRLGSESALTYQTFRATSSRPARCGGCPRIPCNPLCTHALAESGGALLAKLCRTPTLCGRKGSFPPPSSPSFVLHQTSSITCWSAICHPVLFIVRRPLHVCATQLSAPSPHPWEGLRRSDP